MTIAIIDGRGSKPVIIGAGADVAGTLVLQAESAADAAASSAAEAADLLADATLTNAKVKASFDTIITTAVDRPAAGNYNTGNSTNLAIAVMGGEDVPADTPLATLLVPFTFTSSAATKIIVKRSSRLSTDAWLNSQPGNAGDTVIDTREFTLADVGLVSGVGGVATIPLGGQTAPDGTLLIFDVVAVNNSDVPQYNNLSHGPVSGATQQYQYGWYRFEGQAAGFWEAIPIIAIRPAFAVTTELFDTGAGAVKADPFRSASVDVALVGNNLTVSGKLFANGNEVAVSDTVTFTAAAAGKEWAFGVYADRLTGAISTEATEQRDEELDAIEYLPATPAGKILLARALVRDSGAVGAVNCAQFRGLIKIGQEGNMARHVERNRGLLRPVIGKAMRGDAINWGGYGDSITALQTGAPSDSAVRYAANGEWRDRRSVYFSAYPSDTLALLPLFDFGDGSGQVHTKIGWNWSIKAALDAIAGADVVDYLNYGIGGTTSANSDNNGLWPARIAVPLAASLDAVVIAFGMNERGSTSTYANIVNMAGQFQAEGAIPIVMGCPRPHADESVSNWRYTCDALEAAAMDSGAAFISTTAIADDRNLGAMGMPAEALCSTNIGAGGNHPGIFELQQYGRAAVEQLGLA
ncbi:hypothetical protein C7451_106155 [Blastomonas natatoria]|uniref:SGNH hydrolase-type esterase domain-containing protein n=1 Tax=Blastomonas natatoria TaxID=34015 RepID=A0A2V3V4X1_9SPHN|nr:SGNH/GDSL hydrolase family protein [Blastomonas natatoria]PXW75991.1 hypothetical protein C7451_106155 [Blastomonas natatoria]